ncbi:type II secretion system GspH family protein [Candidatus Saccharibacteria bacterium]|nr:type II secretion system GspH family protein [Candidatus Saccharibacteria bacterium]
MRKGFTMIELVFVVLIFGTAAVFFFVQNLRVQAATRDEQRKVSINAIFHNLEHYHDLHGYYPEEIGEHNLRAMDPQLFTDPTGFNLGDESGLSDFRYEPTGCVEGRCRSYTLRSEMEREGDFVRGSRR